MTTLTSLTCQGRLMKALRQHRTSEGVQIGVQHNARARRHSTQQYNDERQEYVLCALERALCIGIAARRRGAWRAGGRGCGLPVWPDVAGGWSVGGLRQPGARPRGANAALHGTRPRIVGTCK